MRKLLAGKDFRRLLGSRFAAQFGDGLFQAGLGGAVLFNPEREADPLAVAAGLAVLLLPYSLIGPFAGALLDRWDRRRVLVVANLLRGTLVLVTAAAVGTGLAGVPLYTAALLVTGCSRFVLAGLSASLPHVARRHELVEANVLAATLGSAMSVVGAGCAVGLRSLYGTDNAGSAWTTGTAVLGSLVAAAVVARFATGKLGPDECDEPSQTMLAVARGLFDGARAAARTPSVAAGFVALVAHRLAFGAAMLLGLLLMRYTFSDVGIFKAGMAGIGEAAAAGGAGLLLAAPVTPRLVSRFGRRGTVCWAFGAAFAAQLGLALPMSLPTLLAATFVIAGAGQIIKLCADAAVQSDVRDELRGRVFALYDTLFNTAYVIAIAAAAFVAPLNGQSVGIMLAAAAVYPLGAIGYVLADRRGAAHVGPVRLRTADEATSGD